LTKRAKRPLLRRRVMIEPGLWPRLAIFVILPSAAHAQQDPAWPCAQRLVPSLSAGSFWPGQITPQPNWRDDDALFPLVTAVIDRDTPDDAATAKLIAYATPIPAARRPALFAALVDQTNDIRDVLIRRLIKLGRRQIAMGQTIAALSSKLDGLKPEDAARESFVGERDLDLRAFSETQHVMRYACEAPANMERRLGTFARLLLRK